MTNKNSWNSTQEIEWDLQLRFIHSSATKSFNEIVTFKYQNVKFHYFSVGYPSFPRPAYNHCKANI